MGLFNSIKHDDDFIRYLSGGKNLDEFLWSIHNYAYVSEFPQIIKYCCDIVMNKRELSKHNREEVIKEMRENLAFYINIYTELTGINKFQKPEKTEMIDRDNHPDYFLFLCHHCHKEFSVKESSFANLRCPHCDKNVSVHDVVSLVNPNHLD